MPSSTSFTEQIAADNLTTWLETEAIKIGTANQRERWAAGVLPEDEMLQLARVELFKGLENFARWHNHDVRTELARLLREKRHEHGCASDRPEFEVADVAELGAAQWETFKKIGAIVDAINMHPWLFRQKASATVASSTLWATCLGCGAEVCASSVKVSIPWAGRMLVREYRL